jgi:membrane protease YdiL (CAAX protease family)
VPIPWASLPALFVELVLYLSLASPWWSRIRREHLPWILIASALPSALLLEAARPHGMTVALLAAIPSLWFAVLPRRRWLDLVFVALMAGVWISPIFDDIYGGKLEVIGKAMWMRLGIAALLYQAREGGIGFGFWPTRAEWRNGARYFALFLAPGLLLAYLLGYLDSPSPRPLQGLAMFAGTLWFVAVGEEFFFRGLLQRWIGLPAAALLYGLSHLGFRQFPNWKHVAITALLGVFCGLAYRRAGSIRAAMVTHALVNGLWVGLLGKVS